MSERMREDEIKALKVGDIVKEFTVMGWAYGPVRVVKDSFVVVEFGWGTKYCVFEDPSTSLYKLEPSDPNAGQLCEKYPWMKP